MESDWELEFDPFVMEKLALYQVPGMAVGFAEQGRPLYQRGYGLRDLAAGAAVTPRTVFGVGSITKSLTCLGVMQLAEAGKLSLSDPVARHLEELRLPAPPTWPQPSIHHLMTHTSGLPPLPTLMQSLMRSAADDPAVEQEEIPPGLQPIDTVHELMAAIAASEVPLLGPPGQSFSYSNEGYALLGAVIERVSGLGYAEYVRRHILVPCGMEQSTFADPTLAGLPEVTELYAAKPGDDGQEVVFAAPGWWQAPAMVSAGFLRSTVPDLLRYLEIYLKGGRAASGRVLSERGIERMLEPYVPVTPGRFYGYGWVIWPDFYGRKLVEHSGGLKGIGAEVGLVPGAGLAGAALANLAGAPSGHVVLAGLGHALGEPVRVYRQPYPVHTCPSGLLDGYVGAYHSGEGEDFRVAVEGDGLSCERKKRRHPLRPVGEDAFTLQERDDETYLRFLRRESASVYAAVFGSRIVYRQGD